MTKHIKKDTNEVNSEDGEIKEHEWKKIEKSSVKQIKPSRRFDEEFGYYFICVNNGLDMIPEYFDEAITCKDSTKWKAAMNRKMYSLVKKMHGHL